MSTLEADRRSKRAEVVRRYRKTEKYRAWVKARRALPKEQAARKESARRSGRKRRTGWSPQAVALALVAQEGRCAICPRSISDSTACADHCHETRRTRGLLCRACNLSLGYYEKWQRPAGLEISVYNAYLERFRGE